MGNLEKLVVLTVLFLGAILVAWSVTDGSNPTGQGPLDGPGGPLAGRLEDDPGGLSAARDRAGSRDRAESYGQDEGDLVSLREGPSSEERVPALDSPAGLQRPAGSRPGGGFALDVSTDDKDATDHAAGAPAAATGPEAPEAGSDEDPAALQGPVRILDGNLRGLRPAASDLYMMYAVRKGDTWNDLALRFYKDTKFTRNLRKDNEEIETLQEGLDLLVPIYDDFAGPVRAPLSPARFASETPGRGSSAKTTPAAGASSSERPLVYEVKSGDTLSEISMAVYGTSTRWREIFEANRDQLEAADRVKIGMQLRIPAPGTTKLPDAPASTKKPGAGSDGAGSDGTGPDGEPAPKKSKVN